MRTYVHYGVSISITVCILLLTGRAMAVVPAENVNTVNDGRIISGKTYYNTPGAVTSFINSGSGGLWLKSGTTLRGQEVDTTGSLTNNGGAVHLYAPNNVVRVDGNIDLNGLKNGQGAYIGDGGKVFIDSAYLFQNGNIFANGGNGGQVQINVGGMTLGEGAQIQANGIQGGVVSINSSGPVDLRRNSVIETSGFGFEGSNVISIEGSLVNVDGLIKANTTEARVFQGGTIRLVATGQTNYQNLKDDLQAATQNSPGDSSAPTLTAQERMFILQRANNQILNHDGDVVIGRDTTNTTPSYIGQLNANGLTPPSRFNSDPANHGGTIIISAMHDVVNRGQLIANGARGSLEANPAITNDAVSGGHGGTISLNAMNNIINDKGRIEANGGSGVSKAGYIDTDGDPFNGMGQVAGIVGGRGGNGGIVAFGYGNTLTNTGGIYADGALGAAGSQPVLNGAGGKGGLVVFSGNANPTGNGSIDVLGRAGGNNSVSMGGQAGTIVSPNPTTLGQTQVYFQQGYENGQPVSYRATQQTQTNEVLVDSDNGDMIALTKNGGNSSTNLLSRLLNANYRTVDNPTGFSSNMLEGHYGMSFANLVVQSSQNNLALDLNVPAGFPPPSEFGQVSIFEYLGSLTIANNGAVTLPSVPGPYQNTQPRNTNFWMGTHFENGITRLSLLAKGDVNNTAASFWNGTVNIATKGNYLGGGVLTTSSNPDYGGTLQAGSIMIKAGNDITQNTQNGSFLTADGVLFGGVIRLFALHDIRYNGSHTEDLGIASAISTNGSLQGGIVTLQAGHDLLINANETPQPEWYTTQAITANGISSINGRGGFVSLKAGNSRHINNVFIEANGGLRNGIVSLDP